MCPFISIPARSKAGWIAMPVLLSLFSCQAPAAGPETGPAPVKPAVRAEVTHRGYLGVTVTEICPEVRAQTTLKEGEGLMIGRVDPQSPAAALGLRHYDILTRFNDQWLMSPAQFATLVENAGPEAEAEITFLRNGGETKTKVRLGRAPARPLTTESLPPLPEEMLTMVIRALRDNPALLENIHRLLQGSALEGAFKRGTKVTKVDERGHLELTIIGADQQVRVWDQNGKLLFEGPCQTPEQLAAMSEDVRVRVEAIQKECKNALRHLPAVEPKAAPSPATVAPLEKGNEVP